MKTVALIYGWGEGAWESQEFRGLLYKKGLQTTNKVSEADIVLAHSSGCYLVPRDTARKTIFLIGLPYWPSRSLFQSGVRKLSAEIKFHRQNQSIGWWLNKILHNCWYILSRPSATYYVLTKHLEKNLPGGSLNDVILVRPKDDTFCHPEVLKLLRKTKSYKFLEIPGAHDDCWINSKPYIDLLLKEI